jgi:butyryl-CoA dehydrogenase
VTALVAQKGLADPDEAGAASADYLRMFALTTLGYLWTRMAEIALPHVDGPEAAFYRAKLATARFFVTRLLPHASSHAAAIMAGAKPIMELDEAAF